MNFGLLNLPHNLNFWTKLIFRLRNHFCKFCWRRNWRYNVATFLSLRCGELSPLYYRRRFLDVDNRHYFFKVFNFRWRIFGSCLSWNQMVNFRQEFIFRNFHVRLFGLFFLFNWCFHDTWTFSLMFWLLFDLFRVEWDVNYTDFSWRRMVMNFWLSDFLYNLHFRTCTFFNFRNWNSFLWRFTDAC